MSGDPGENLSDRTLPIRIWKRGDTWLRIHRSDKEAKWFGPAPGEPPTFRFDDPEGEYRVCYLGASLAASFSETLLRNPPRRLLSLRELRIRRVTAFRLTRDLRLVAFHSAGLVQLGLTARESHGSYDVCGRWARVFWMHSDAPDGIEYRSRHDDAEFCIALFDWASAAIEESSVADLMAEEQRMRALLRHYTVRLTH